MNRDASDVHEALVHLIRLRNNPRCIEVRDEVNEVMAILARVVGRASVSLDVGKVYCNKMGEMVKVVRALFMGIPTDFPDWDCKTMPTSTQYLVAYLDSSGKTVPGKYYWVYPDGECTMDNEEFDPDFDQSLLSLDLDVVVEE